MKIMKLVIGNSNNPYMTKICTLKPVLNQQKRYRHRDIVVYTNGSNIGRRGRAGAWYGDGITGHKLSDPTTTLNSGVKHPPTKPCISRLRALKTRCGTFTRLWKISKGNSARALKKQAISYRASQRRGPCKTGDTVGPKKVCHPRVNTSSVFSGQKPGNIGSFSA